MERLILSTWPRSTEENEIRKIQFAALIERRNEAARHFLQEAAVGRRISGAEKSDRLEKSGPPLKAPVSFRFISRASPDSQWARKRCYSFLCVAELSSRFGV